MSAKILRALFDIDATLARAGVPAMSQYWRAEAERFYPHPTALTLVEEAGRGAGKDLMACKMAEAEQLAGDFGIPTGERHYHIHIAENLAEATKTRRILEAHLRILGVRFTPNGDALDLADLPRGFLVLACRVGAASGWRCTGWTANECAKWTNDGVNPSAEVIASMRGMTVTHRTARGRLFSSPLTRSGYFHEAVQRGDTAEQLVGHAASWEANPSITEEQTRKLEPDARVWRREYLAVPQASALAAFDADAIERAFRVPDDIDKLDKVERVLVIDASSGKSDTWSYGIAGWLRNESGRYIRRRDGSLITWPDGSPRENPDWRPAKEYLCFELVDGIGGNFWNNVSGDEIVEKVADLAKKRGARTVIADQRESLMLKSAFSRHGMRYLEHPWTSENKSKAIELLRRWFAEGVLLLPEHAQMRRELYAFEEKITASGAFTYAAAHQGHDDFVALLVTAAIAELAGKLPRSPFRPQSGPLLGQTRITPF